MRLLTYFSFVGGNAMDSETSLDVIDQSEEFAGLFYGDDIWKSLRVSRKSSKFIK